ncbi:type IV pilus biogenesis protein PilM [Paenibacillus glycinis]|uniref:Pilus assembly protein PilM n=1 Tax=Paenibacillus glycinis TaxID=2697035 RepID=A0ABW9XRR2_9BACL|nr:pilus assembly protein PilM [Paenibacillus glycinis]NBD25344.1 pilus assembly protein PilM [Paenibacillus glycinis]
MKTRNTRTVGLTIDGTGIRYASLRKRRSWALEKSGFLPLPEGQIVDDGIVNAADVGSALKAWAKRENLAGAAVKLAVPTSQIIVRKLRIPTTNAKELKPLIELEVETTLHLPFEDPVFDYVALGKDEESTLVLIFAAPLKWIRTSVQVLEEAGLRVRSISLPAAALAKTMLPQQGEKTSETMIVHIGEQTLEIFMFHEGSPIFMRAINLAEMGEHEPGKLNDGQVAELIAEISRILNFYQFGLHEGASRITRAVVAGSPEGRRKLLAALSEAQPEIAFAEAAGRLFQNGSGLTDDNIAYLVPTGLALPEERASFQVDLLPRIDREARIFPVVIIGAAALFLVLIALSGYSFAVDRLSIADNKQTLRELDDSMLRIQNDLLAGKDAGAGSASSDPLAEIGAIREQQQDVVGIVRELDAKLPKGARIMTIGYAANGRIEISAGFDALKDASRYLFDLRRMSFADTASLLTISKLEVAATVQGNGKLTVNKPYSAVYSITTKREQEEKADGTAQ